MSITLFWPIRGLDNGANLRGLRGFLGRCKDDKACSRMIPKVRKQPTSEYRKKHKPKS